MARWDRAARWLPPDARRLLDVGCAFGFGTVRLAAALARNAGARGQRSLTIGLEFDAGYARQAHRRYPELAVVRGSAAALPFPDASFEVVTLLDVLEHLPAERPALAEACRVLRPGGVLVVSVPHAGPLAGTDSLNIYDHLRRRWRVLPPLDPTERGHPVHRHYRLAELGALLGPGWRLERVTGSGLGLAEPLNLVLLLVCRGLLRSEPAYRLLRYAYFALHLLDDLLPTGRYAYNLTLLVRKESGT